MTALKYKKYITVDPKIRFGKPIVKNTRVPVDLVVGKIAGGMTIEAIMDEYELTKAQVMATLQYAADLVSDTEVAYA